MHRFAFLIVLLTSFTALAQSDSYVAKGLEGALWVQTSTEWTMTCGQAYRLAQMQLDEVLAHHDWSAALEQTGNFSEKPPAVILDIDETVLNNIAFQGTAILEEVGFSSALWDAWIAKRAATVLPGALDFVKAAQAKGVTVFYVTNRECGGRPYNDDPCPQETDTIENLKALGFLGVTPERMLLKSELPEWSSEKQSRRAIIARDYRIVMLLGDDLGDFLPNVKKGPGASLAQRAVAAKKYEAWWGVRWIILPNPIYGSWLKVLGKKPETALKGFR